MPYQGYGNLLHRITDIEKTIIDCFDLPEYSGGYAELLRALSLAKLNVDKMIEYCDTINNIAITSRIGFLAELTDKKGMKNFVKYSRQITGVLPECEVVRKELLEMFARINLNSNHQP